jgi:DNA-binding HxlR family transcriptional regulator
VVSTPGVERERGDLFDPNCSTRWLVDRIGSKWVSMIVKVLAEEPSVEVRFAALRRRTPGISQKMLSQTLRTLERDGLVTRRVEPTVPPRVHYALTPLGHSLEARLAVLRDWAEEHMRAVGDARAAYDAVP